MLSIEIYLHQENECLEETIFLKNHINMIGINSTTSITKRQTCLTGLTDTTKFF